MPSNQVLVKNKANTVTMDGRMQKRDEIVNFHFRIYLGASTFYISPLGNDQVLCRQLIFSSAFEFKADGQSVGSAWRTLGRAFSLSLVALTIAFW